MASVPPSVPPRGIMCLRKWLLWGGLLLFVGLCVGSFLAVHGLLRPAPKVEKPLPASTITALQGRRTPVLQDEPRTYEQIPKPKPPPATPLPPRGVGIGRVEAATPPPAAPTPRVASPQPLAVPSGPSPAEVEARIQAAVATERARMLEAQLAAERARTTSQTGPAGQQTTQAVQPGQQPTKPKGPPRWFGSIGEGKSMTIAKAKEEKPAGTQSEKEESQTLIARAKWAKPVQVEKVLYWDMPIVGTIQTGTNSDAPAQVIIKTVRTVWDREMRGVEILPALTSLRGRPLTQVRFGQQRQMIDVDQMILPNGTVVDLPKSALSDPSGAGGIPAAVDNHYGALALGMLFSVGFNIGTRYATGNPQGYQQSNEQEIAREAGQAVNREAQQIAAQFRRPPTLTTKPGEEVTLYAVQNINFSQLPIRVR